MANDNKIQLDLEISNTSIESTFGLVDQRGVKSAKSSAIAFETEFQRQEQILKDTIKNLTNESKTYVRKSAEESALVFRQAFEKQNAVYKASVKQNLDQALDVLTNKNGVKKSAADSAAAFEEAFSKVEAPKIVGAASSKLNLTDIAAGYFLVTRAAASFQQAAQAALNVVLDGEAEIKLEARFRALAEQAGIAAGVIENELVAAARGLIQDEELFNVASSAFIRIGENARRLPEVLDVARKSYKVFGGEVANISETIISATETGNKRSLRAIGLYTDLDSAVKSYAIRLGTVPQLLTEQQVQQARLSAILETAQTRFKNVSTEVDTVKDSFTRAKVSFGEFIDELNKDTARSSSGVFKSLADGAANFFDKLKNNAEVDNAKFIKPKTAEDAIRAIDTLTKKNEDYTRQLQELDNTQLRAAGSFAYLQGFIKQNENAINRLKGSVADFREIQKLLDARAPASSKEVPVDLALQEEKLRRRKEVESKILDLNKNLLASEIELAQQNFELSKSEADRSRILLLQKQQANEDYLIKKAELEKFFALNATATESEKNLALEALGDASRNRILKLNTDFAAKNREALLAASVDIQSFSEGFNEVLRGMTMGFQDFTTSMKANLKDVGKAFVTTFRTQATSAIFQFAQGSKNASEAAQGLFTGILNAMGEMLISQGLGFILQGAAFTYAGLPNGPALAGAGAAMIAFGATLAAISAANGGKTGASSGGGATGGAAAVDYNSNNPNTPIVETKPENPNTQINVNVGAVFDRKETGMWITDVLSENFEQNGILVRSNV